MGHKEHFIDIGYGSPECRRESCDQTGSGGLGLQREDLWGLLKGQGREGAESSGSEVSLLDGILSTHPCLGTLGKSLTLPMMAPPH